VYMQVYRARRSRRLQPTSASALRRRSRTSALAFHRSSSCIATRGSEASCAVVCGQAWLAPLCVRRSCQSSRVPRRSVSSRIRLRLHVFDIIAYRVVRSTSSHVACRAARSALSYVQLRGTFGVIARSARLRVLRRREFRCIARRREPLHAVARRPRFVRCRALKGAVPCRGASSCRSGVVAVMTQIERCGGPKNAFHVRDAR
jgi:hypothetical protein